LNPLIVLHLLFFFFFQAEDGIRDRNVTGVQTCALPISTTRIMPLHIGKGRTESRAISDIIDYVANPQKTDNGKLITSYGCDSRTADAEFLLAKRQYIAAT